MKQQYIEVFVHVSPRDLQNDLNGWLERNKESHKILCVQFALGNGEYGAIVTYTDMDENPEQPVKGKKDK